MLGGLKQAVDKGEYISVMCMDLSETFDTFQQVLYIFLKKFKIILKVFPRKQAKYYVDYWEFPHT